MPYGSWCNFANAEKFKDFEKEEGEKGEEVGLIYSWCSSGSFYEAFQSSSFREDWK